MLNFNDKHFTLIAVKGCLFHVFQNSPCFMGYPVWADGVTFLPKCFTPWNRDLSNLLETKLKDQACDMANCCSYEAENSKLFSSKSAHWNILMYAGCVPCPELPWTTWDPLSCLAWGSGGTSKPCNIWPKVVFSRCMWWSFLCLWDCPYS